MVATPFGFLPENLRADDFSVLTAGTGSEAMEVLAASRPDVLLLDVVLPDMSGYDVCRRVRESDPITSAWDPEVPIIMLSAKVEHTDRVRGLTRGADDYVTKPSASTRELSEARHSAFPASPAKQSTGLSCARGIAVMTPKRRRSLGCAPCLLLGSIPLVGKSRLRRPLPSTRPVVTATGAPQ